ncbi:hypothetical protein XMIN_1463 [Xanthomonas citri pv. mangiferaeindicae LMG 941]|nr:hypothetical protein XMIN_1463 [Xanthomonas citri pv. mangiferaeindicae LMG 941]
MKKQTLAMAADQGAGFEQHRRRRGEMYYCRRWSRSCRGRRCVLRLSLTNPTRGWEGHSPVELERMLRMTKIARADLAY